MSDLLPSLAAHEELVALAERRVRRAMVRLQSAEREHEEASKALTAAASGRAAWIAANPDPQLMML